MATFFDSQIIGWWVETYNYIYGTLTGDVTRSGNTVTLSNMVLAHWLRYSGYGTDPNWWIKVNGTITYSMNIDLPSHALNSTSFNVTDDQTSATISWSTLDGNSGSFTVTFPAGTVEPAKPTATILSKTDTSATFRVQADNYGKPSSEAERYIEAAILSTSSYGPPYRYQTEKATLDARITVDNTSKQNPDSPMTIVGNTRYYYGAYITNTKRANSNVVGTFITLPSAPTLTFTSSTLDSATVGYSFPAGGGALSRTRYVDGSTVSSDSSSKNIYNLSPNKAITISGYQRTTEGSSSYGTISFYTKPSTPVILNKFSAQTAVSFVIDADASTKAGDLTPTALYRLSGETVWQAASIGSPITVADLQPDTTYTFQAKLNNGTDDGTPENYGKGDGPVYNFVIKTRPESASNLYGSVGNKSVRLNKVYASVNNKSVELTKIYGSVDGKSVLLLG